MTDWTALLQPLELGSKTMRNRVIVTSHTTCFVDGDNLPDDRDIAYFAARAAGGAALMCTGTNAVHPSSPGPYGLYKNFDERIVPRQAAVAQAVHEEGGLMLAQLGHLAQRRYDEPVPVWSPSAIAHHTGGGIPHEMTASEVAEVVEAFAAAAERSVRAGMDGVEIAFGHGQLINLFLSPLTNRRTDGYGGSAENRMRFAREVTEAIRGVLGDGPIVGARVNGMDGFPGGLTAEEWIEISRTLAATGLISYVNVSLNFEESLVPGMHQPHGAFLPYAAALRKQVSIPVFSTGRVTDPEEALAAVAAGLVDAIGMTRGHIADPEIVAKLEQGRRAEIRPCIGCGHLCIGAVHRGRPISCIYNPVTGHEEVRGKQLRERAASAKDVVVVGGGPGGMEAARVAAQRGHSVTLLEREQHLGGSATLAGEVPGREEFARLVDWYESCLDRLGVDVHTGVEAKAETLGQLSPDALILACGSLPGTPPWAEGLDKVISIRELIRDKVEIDGKAAIVDYDHFGQSLQAALCVLRHGGSPIVISERVAVAGEIERPSLEDLYSAVLEQGGALKPMRHVIAAEESDGRVRLTLFDPFTRQSETLVVDMVVTTAAQADETLMRELADRRAIAIGDLVSPRQVGSAVHEGFAAAVSI